jgi:hypothetical protein
MPEFEPVTSRKRSRGVNRLKMTFGKTTIINQYFGSKYRFCFPILTIVMVMSFLRSTASDLILSKTWNSSSHGRPACTSQTQRRVHQTKPTNLHAHSYSCITCNSTLFKACMRCYVKIPMLSFWVSRLTILMIQLYQYSSLNIVALLSSETLVSTYKCTWLYYPQDQHRRVIWLSVNIKQKWHQDQTVSRFPYSLTEHRFSYGIITYVSVLHK